MDVRKFIEEVKKMGLLKEIKGAHWNLEIGAISDLNAKSKKYTLLFDEIADYPKGFRVLTGAMLDSRRASLILGFPPILNDAQLVTKLKERLSYANREYKNYDPIEISDASLLENVDKEENVNLFKFPAPKWHELDGGRYIGTGDAVITKDPESDWVNVGTYRVMLVDKNKLAIMIIATHHARWHIDKYLKQGKKAPIAISFGPPPSLFVFSGAEVPAGISEYNYAGAAIGERFKVFRGEMTGLPIPADSEIAIEGYITGEVMDEGPFGEYTGYYGEMTKSFVIEVKRIYHRHNPILLGSPPGIPPHDFSYFRCAIRSAMIRDFLEKAGVPAENIKGVWTYEAGFSSSFTVISIKQSSPGFATKVGHLVVSSSLGGHSKYIIIVDDDIDPFDINQVIWAMSSRSDPAASIDVIKNIPTSPLDPIAEKIRVDTKTYAFSNTVVIYAVKPFEKLIRNEFPLEVKLNSELTEKITKKWSELFS